MEQINHIELSDPGIYPSEEVLMRVLENTYGVYNEMLSILVKYGLVYEWRYYKDGKAWLCKVTKGKKTIIWMSAWKGFLKATIYLQEKHVDGIRSLDLGEKTKVNFMNARNVGKSKPCMFEIQDTKIFKDFEEMIRYKIRVR